MLSLITMNTKKIAVVGSGCSGIAAFWALEKAGHDVYLYEADDRLGGHTNTVHWKAGKYSVEVDTGFIVLNTATYRKYIFRRLAFLLILQRLRDLHFTAANFINFLASLNIQTTPTRMDLSVSKDHGSFEWGGKSLASVFCQTKNLFSVQMWRMLFDVVRFNQFALDVLINEADPIRSQDVGECKTDTIGIYLKRNGYSDAFRDGYLIPITAAVWSTSPNLCINEFPTVTLIRFL